MLASLALGILTLSSAGNVRAGDPDPAEVKAVIDKAVAGLKPMQGAHGGFAPKLGGPGITALIAAGFIRAGYSPDDPVVAKCLAYLEKNVQKDGGVYNRQLANYTTCVALMAFKDANTNGKYDVIIANAAKFLKSLQGD